MIQLGGNFVKRIYIFGPPGSGKTHTAFILSTKLQIKKYNLDDIYWKEKYSVKNSSDKIKKRLSKIIFNDSWIIEGTYGADWVCPIIKRSDLVIWIRPSFLSAALNIIRRFFRKWQSDKSEGWKSTFDLIKKTYLYNIKSKNSSYLAHNSLIMIASSKVRVFKSHSEIDCFLNKLVK